MAAEYPFKRIMGVEYLYKYCRAAEQNIEIVRDKIPASSKIEIECTDAFWWVKKKWPKQQNVFLSMYMPWVDTMESYGEFFKLVAEQSKKYESSTIIAFVNPAENMSELIETAGFEKLAEGGMDAPEMEKLIRSWTVHRCIR
jgi:hypothetical protein